MLDRTKTFRTVNHVLVSFSFSNFSGFHFSFANLVPLFITWLLWGFHRIKTLY